MFARSAVVFALGLVCALAESTWGPADSVRALDAVIAAVNKVAATPGLKTDEATHARQVAVDVKESIEDAENNKNLTKAQAHQKVGEALKELRGLQSALLKAHEDMKPKNITALKEKMAEMQKELAEKKALIAKDEAMIKLANLQKELMEKKLKLQKLLAQRGSKQDVKKQQIEQGKQESEMVKHVLSAADGLQAKNASKDELPAPLKAVLANLKGRETKIASELEKDVAAEAKYEAALDKKLKELPNEAKSADLAKGQHMLKSLKAQEKRQFRKAEASKKIELGELKEAEASIEKRDVAGLKKIMNKMQAESKALQAKSGDFLH